MFSLHETTKIRAVPRGVRRAVRGADLRGAGVVRGGAAARLSVGRTSGRSPRSLGCVRS